MEQNIRLDVNHMMADMLGSEYGVTQAQLAAMQDAAMKAQHAVEANRGTGWLGWMNLPYNQEEIVSEIEKVAEHVRKTFKYFVVLGIGGSALGPIAVHQALNHLHYNELPDSKRPGPKFYVEDNIDPERMAALMDVIELDKACFCIISKSGGTAETMSQYLIVTEALKAQNIDAQPLDLLTGTIPEDCDLLIISDPASDFAADGLVNEIAQLQTYLENGGKVLLTTSGYTETPNLDAVMAQFGLAREPGLVVEGDAGHALYGYPYSLFPDYATADESTALDGVNQSTHVMLSVAQGVTITETDDVTAEPLLYTTEDAYSKQDFDASSSSAKEAGDTDGPFSLAVWARNDSTGAEVIWIGCPNMDNEQVYQSIPGNLTFLQGCAASLVGQSLLIDTKALEAAPITVPASASMTLGMVFVFVLPAAVLIAGAVEVLLRRRR